VRRPDPQRSRAVILGTATYHSTLPDVPAVACNVRDLVQVLTASHEPVVAPEHCAALLDEPDRALVGRTLLTAARAAEDLLLVYYSGHGLLSEPRRELHLCMPATEPEALGFTAIHIDLLRDAILDSPADNRVLILDCCYSGRAIPTTLGGGAGTVIGQIEVKGTYTMTAASGHRLALTLPGERNTAFTGRLLSLLRREAPDQEAAMSLGAIYRRLRSTMVAESLPAPEQCGTGTADQLILGGGGSAVPGRTEPDRTDDRGADAAVRLRARAAGDPLLRRAFAEIDRACDRVRDVVAAGGVVLFVGTGDGAAAEAIADEAIRAGMPYVNARWLGGMLTNFRTVQRRLRRIDELEAIAPEYRGFTAKERLQLDRELAKLRRGLAGMRGMTRLPDIVWMATPRLNHVAFAEAVELGIPVIAADDHERPWHRQPEMDLVISCDHEALHSTTLVTSLIADAVLAGTAASRANH
jgi:ribosomal protein S2